MAITPPDAHRRLDKINDPIKFDRTDRGFVIGDFYDRYGIPCSIQQSSIATENCIWLGRNQDENGQDILGRMHLTQERAAELILILQRFVETGELS